jgi:cystathionine beta-lyase/cystathionine gamma-synthase
MKYEMKTIHAGIRNEESIRGVNVSIHLSSTYVQPSLTDFQDFVYARGNNPTCYYVETVVAELRRQNMDWLYLVVWQQHF